MGGLLVVGVLLTVLVAALVTASPGDDDSQVDPTALPTTVTTGPAPAPEGGGGVPWLPWLLVAVLAVALAVALGRLARRTSAGSSGPAGPQPAAVAAGPLPGTEVQVFISHDADADGAVARTLADHLRRRRLLPWLAPDSIPPGEPWVFAIEAGLLASRAALVLVSSAALRSGWVRKEIQMIVDLEVGGRLHVVPVRVEACDMPLILGGYQWVDVAGFDRAADDLARRFRPRGGG